MGDLRERMSEAEFVQWTRWHAVREQSRELAHAQAAARQKG